MEASEVKIRLTPEFREQMNHEILRRVCSAVDGAAVRDEILHDYAAQVDNLDNPIGDGPWTNSSAAEDNLTLDTGMGMASYLMAAVQGEPPAIIEAINPEDMQMASDIEAAFAVKLHVWGTKELVYDVAHNATFFPSAPVRIGWKNITSKFRSVADIDAATGLPVDDNTPEDAEIIPQQPIVQSTTISNGPDQLALDPWDIYPYPANAQKYDDAEGIAEKILLTRRDLVMGIDAYDYDKREVAELIKGGPTNYTVSERDEADGVTGDPEDGDYECYLFTGYMPMFFDADGHCTTPKYLQNEDFQWVVCPAHNSVFRFGPNAYPFRQYDAANIFRYPNRRDGRCVTSMMAVAQECLTAMVRLQENIVDLTADPMLVAPASMRDELDGKENKPGGIYFVPPNGELKPLVWDLKGYEIAFSFAQDCRMRAEKTMGMGQGVTQLSQKSNRSAQEIGQLGDNSIMRRDLFLQTFLEWLDRHYANIATLWFAHMGDDGEVVIAGGKPVEIEKMADFSSRFTVRAHSNAMAGNPEMQRQLEMLKQQVQMQYIGSLMQFPPMYWPMIYHGARSILATCGDRSIIGWLGPEPNAGDPQAILMQLGQMLMQAANQTADPAMAQAAQQMLQIIQQGMMQGQQGQPGQPGSMSGAQGQAGGGGAGPAGGFGSQPPQSNGSGGAAIRPGRGSAIMVDVGPTGLAAAPLKNGMGS